jgi:hypothetical protein
MVHGAKHNTPFRDLSSTFEGASNLLLTSGLRLPVILVWHELIRQRLIEHLPKNNSVEA